MFSIVLPVGGSSSFYIECVLKNTYETCGYSPSKVDFVILAGKEIHPTLKEELFFLSFKYKFRILQTPFEEIWHLPMLDWMVANDKELKEWIVPIHLDGFWLAKDNWLVEYYNQIKANPKGGIIVPGNRYYWSEYFYNNKWIDQTYDHIGAYNCDFLREKNLRFLWGVKDESELSPKLAQLIHEEQILTNRFSDGKIIPVKKDNWYDGSQLIGIECAVNYPEAVIAVNKSHNQFHIGGFNRFSNSIIKTDENLYCGFSTIELKNGINGKWAFHSFITSYFLDKDIHSDIIFPWNLIKNYATLPVQNDHFGKTIKMFHKYFGEHPNSLGLNSNNGIKTMQFYGKKMNPIKLFN